MLFIAELIKINMATLKKYQDSGERSLRHVMNLLSKLRGAHLRRTYSQICSLKVII